MGEEPSDIYEAISYDPDTRCSGDRTFHECATAKTLTSAFGLSERIDGKGKSADTKPNQLHTYAYLPVGCVACGAMCELSQILASGVSGTHAQLRSMSPETFNRTRAPILEKLIRDALESLRDTGDQITGVEAGDNITTDEAGIFDTIDSH